MGRDNSDLLCVLAMITCKAQQHYICTARIYDYSTSTEHNVRTCPSQYKR
jgi:hypothetical protein